jgi:UPF0716 protein FxsA
MALFGRLALLFVLVPILELLLLIRLGQVVGLWPTLGLVLFTGFAGAALARAEGFRVLVAAQRELTAGRLPSRALLDGMCVLVGAALLLTPGVLTDVAGLLLLLPPTRRWVQGKVLRSLERRIRDGTIRFDFLASSAWPPGPGRREGPVDTPDLDPSKEIRIEVPEP